MLSVNNIGGQFWLTGARSGTGNSDIGDRAYTQNIYGNPLRGTADSYKWIIRSQPGNGDLSYEDPRASEDCVKYGDRVYLQVMSAERRWLSGGRYDGNNRVRLSSVGKSGRARLQPPSLARAECQRPLRVRAVLPHRRRRLALARRANESLHLAQHVRSVGP